MEIKRDAFAVFDCKKEGWTDKSSLSPHLLKSGQRSKFVFYVYDSYTNHGAVAVAEDPQEAADRICIAKFISPTDLVILTMAVNIEQVEMLDHELEDGDLDAGIDQSITPDEFMKNMVRMFGSMIMTIRQVLEGAPASASLTYSCDGGQCTAEINGKPDISTFGECVDVMGVDKDQFIEHVNTYMEHDEAEGPICSSKNQMFVKITDNKPDTDFSDWTMTQLMSEIVKLRFASHVEQENQAINNHTSLMAFGVVMEGTLEDAVNANRIISHFDPDTDMRKIRSAGRVMGGTLNMDIVMSRPEVNLPPLFTPNYIMERFSSEFPTEEPLEQDEIEFVMEYLGMRGYYDAYPDDPHVLTVATSMMQTVIFLKRLGDREYVDCGLGFFLTPIGISEIIKTVVKLRFFRDSRHAVLEVANDVQKKAELGVLIDRYTDVFEEALGEYLVEVTKNAVGKFEFDDISGNQKEPEKPERKDSSRDKGIEIDLFSGPDFDDLDSVKSCPK